MLPTLIALCIVIAVGVFIWALFAGDRKKKEAAQERDPISFGSRQVQHARVGDVLVIPGAGDDYDDLTFTIDRLARYRSASGNWHELSGLYKNRRFYLEVDDDDDLVCWLSLEAEPTLDEFGLDEDRLIAYDEGDNPGPVVHGDYRFAFEKSGEIGCSERDGAPFEDCYQWEFVSDDGATSLTIEKWEDEPFEASLTKRVPPEDITVLRAES